MGEADRHKVLGLGGVFVRARDPAALAAWYREHLGFDVHDFGGSFGAIFNFADREPGYQLWTAFPAETPYFGTGPSAGARTVRGIGSSCGNPRRPGRANPPGYTPSAAAASSAASLVG